MPLLLVITVGSSLHDCVDMTGTG